MGRSRVIDMYLCKYPWLGLPTIWLTLTSGRPIGNLSHDHSCSNNGHPSKAELSLVNWQALHIPQYVAAKTVEPQLHGVHSSWHVASAIPLAKWMYRALMVDTWFSVNIPFPSSHIMYASRLRVICGVVIRVAGNPNLCIY